MKGKKLYRVAWKHKGNIRHGTWQEDVAVVDAQVEYGNRKFPKIEHYREERDTNILEKVRAILNYPLAKLLEDRN